MPSHYVGRFSPSPEIKVLHDLHDFPPRRNCDAARQPTIFPRNKAYLEMRSGHHPLHPEPRRENIVIVEEVVYKSNRQPLRQDAFEREFPRARREVSPPRKAPQPADRKPCHRDYDQAKPKPARDPRNEHHRRPREPLLDPRNGQPRRHREPESARGQNPNARGGTNKWEGTGPFPSTKQHEDTDRDPGFKTRGPRRHQSKGHKPGESKTKHGGADENGRKNPLDPVPETLSPDYYAILGIPIDASEDEIKKAAKKMRIELHPDKLKTPEMSESECEGIDKKAAQVGQAADVLMDPEQKRKYDRKHC